MKGKNKQQIRYTFKWRKNMKPKLTKEEYFTQNETAIKELLKYFELENLTDEEKCLLITPLIDSTLKSYFTPPLLKMPIDTPSNIEQHYHGRILLILLKYVLETNDKLNYLKKISDQNEQLIQQNQEIITLLKSLNEK